MAYLSDLTGYLNAPATLNSPGAVGNQGASQELTLPDPVIAATSAPSGLQFKSYRWITVNGLTTIYWSLHWATPGVMVTSCTIPFPTAPVPWAFTGQPANAWVYLGTGGLYTDLNTLANGSAIAGIYKDAGGTLSLKTTAGTSALASKYSIGLVSYLSAS